MASSSLSLSLSDTTKKHRHAHSHSPSCPSEPSGAPSASSTPDIDRILPFLTAHFGSAELVSISRPSPGPIKTEQAASIEDEEEEGGEAVQIEGEDRQVGTPSKGESVEVSDADGKEGQAVVEGVGEGEKRPTIVIKVDEHEAWIDLLTMVRPFFPFPFFCIVPKRRLT